MERYSPNDVSRLEGRGVFFDANVLIFLYGGGNPEGYQQSVYSRIFSELVKMKNSLHVDYIVISEFVNRLFRIGYKSYLDFNGLDEKRFSFKEYRATPEANTCISGIYSTVENDILKHFRVIGKAFTKEDITGFLEVDNLDFSDKAIEMICRENRFVLLTDDADFAKSEIDILSANGNIVSQ
ncbi:MAG: twitching motility protein PilT [Candidatus Cloacimonetes bacterium]|nr:twitching motility protein PilT [Candidatus Cloacimonadota bacterium]